MSLPFLSWKHRLVYSLGGAGWVILDRLLLTWALYFYLPPDGNNLPERIPAGALLGVFTVWGFVGLSGRVIDGITDPLIANLSDQSRHPFGRRRIFMCMGLVPMCVLCASVFFPPENFVSLTNVVFVTLVFWAFYVSFTLYAVPYAALLPELGRDESGCLQPSLWQATAQLLAAGLVMIGAPYMLGFFDGKDPSHAYQYTAVVFSLLAFLLMLAPIVGIHEPKLCATPSQKKNPLRQTLRDLLAWPKLRWFLFGTVGYWFGFNTVATCVPYYVTVLMRLNESDVGWILGATFATCGLFFPVVWLAAKRVGKSLMMVVGTSLQAILMLGIVFVDSPQIGIVFMGLAGIPTAVVMAVPPAMLADLAREDKRRSGVSREAMIFALLAFLLKVNLGISAAIIAALLQFGKSVDNPLGILLTGPVASIILVLAAVSFWKAHKLEGENG